LVHRMTYDDNLFQTYYKYKILFNSNFVLDWQFCIISL
jgi:hypothetical protein